MCVQGKLAGKLQAPSASYYRDRTASRPRLAARSNAQAAWSVFGCSLRFLSAASRGRLAVRSFGLSSAFGGGGKMRPSTRACLFLTSRALSARADSTHAHTLARDSRQRRGSSVELQLPDVP